MENNNKGDSRGIFYAIMGISTLVITLIGATFAYFVAVTNSANNAIRANTTSVSLEFDDNTSGPTKNTAHITNAADGNALETGIRSKLIPVDTLCTAADVQADQSKAENLRNCVTANGTSVAFAKKGYTGWDDAHTNQNTTYDYAGEGLNDCRDSNGDSICSVYQFTVTNPAGNPAQTVYPKFTVTTLDTSLASLKYALFKGTAAQVAASPKGWDVNGTPVTSQSVYFHNADKGSLDRTDLIVSNKVSLTSNGGVSFLKTTAASATRKKVIAEPGDLIIPATSLTAGLVESGTLGGANGWSRLVQILDTDESMTYTMIIWLEEDYSNQSDEMNKNFTAQVNFTTEGNSTGVTGSLIMQ